MKLSLIVANGVHAGKGIPITVPQFVIGRDPQCQLRPASPSISKRHCAILIRGKQVLIRDFGSTNGTFVNGQLVEGEVALKDGDTIKVGPLDFKVSLSMTAPAPAASKAGKSAVEAPVAATIGGEPSSEDTVSLEAPPSEGPSSDKLAALLLDEEPSGAKSNVLGPEAIPEGSTIMEVPAQAQEAGRPAPPPKKSVVGAGNTSDAAAEILKRYQRRPRTG
jgi:pSer/pThr/pTyr-binding forkhead associated (FHA) protein